MSRNQLPSAGDPRYKGFPERPAPRLPWYPYFNVPKEGDLLTVLLSNQLLVLETHWVYVSRNVVYCSGPRDCVFCKLAWTPALYGYAAAQELQVVGKETTLGRYGLVAIPEEALYNSPSLLLARDDLRGQILRQFRFSGHGYTAAVRAELEDLYSAHKRLRPAWDVRADMARRFGFAPEKLRPLSGEKPYLG